MALRVPSWSEPHRGKWLSIVRLSGTRKRLRWFEMARYVYQDVTCMKVDKPYGCLAFIFDIIMTFITGGLWLIWIFVREMRRR